MPARSGAAQVDWKAAPRAGNPSRGARHPCDCGGFARSWLARLRDQPFDEAHPCALAGAGRRKVGSQRRVGGRPRAAPGIGRSRPVSASTTPCRESSPPQQRRPPCDGPPSARGFVRRGAQGAVVSIDGAPPENLFLKTKRLAVGPHTFSAEVPGPSKCCEPLRLDEEIRPDDGSGAAQQVSAVAPVPRRLTRRPHRKRPPGANFVVRFRASPVPGRGLSSENVQLGSGRFVRSRSAGASNPEKFDYPTGWRTYSCSLVPPLA